MLMPSKKGRARSVTWHVARGTLHRARFAPGFLASMRLIVSSMHDALESLESGTRDSMALLDNQTVMRVGTALVTGSGLPTPSIFAMAMRSCRRDISTAVVPTTCVSKHTFHAACLPARTTEDSNLLGKDSSSPLRIIQPRDSIAATAAGSSLPHI